MSAHLKRRHLSAFILFSAFAVSQPAIAQRVGENAVAEADDAFGMVVGNEVIGLYSASVARGFNPSTAANLRINGMYFDQAAAPNGLVVRGSAIHVGISAQGYPFPAPTGVVDFDLRVPGNKPVTSVVTRFGSFIGEASPTRNYVELSTQAPVVKDVLRIGVGASRSRNGSYQVAVRDTNLAGSAVAQWTPSDALTITPFWSWIKTAATGGDRPRVFIGDNPVPKFRAKQMTSPSWLFFGFQQFNYGSVARLELPDQWELKVGLFRSENRTPASYTGFLLNTNAQGRGDYAIERNPKRATLSTSGEIRLSKAFTENVRRHTLYVTTRARDRDSTFGGGDLKRFGQVTLGAFPALAEPLFNPGITTQSHTRQVTGGVGYEGVWRDVGQLSLAVQKSSYERTLKLPTALPVTGEKQPWLYNAGAAAYVSPSLAVYAGYTRGLEELGTAPGNAVNRDEAVPADLTRQVDAGVRYQIQKGLQLVAGGFMIDKPYYGLDPGRFYRQLGTIRHSGIEVSLAGSITEQFTVVAGAVVLRPRITNTFAVGGTTQLTAVDPIPRLIRMNLQYRPTSVQGLVFDTKIESIGARFLTANNSQRLPAVVTLDAGARYTTRMAKVPVTLRLQATNLTNTFTVTPLSSGQIQPQESRRYEMSITADF